MPASEFFIARTIDGAEAGITYIDRDTDLDQPEYIYLSPTPPTIGQIWPSGAIEYEEEEVQEQGFAVLAWSTTPPPLETTDLWVNPDEEA